MSTKSLVRSPCALALLALLATSCTDLAPLPAGVCGNTVIEPGEDCDVHVDPAHGASLACVPPGDRPRQCHYDCSAGCPAGWACGPDDVCVHGTDELVEAPGSPFELAGERWLIADADGDGRADVIGVLPDELRALFGDTDGALRDAMSRHLAGRNLAAPAVGDFDGDGRADVLAGSRAGIEVLRGDASRVLSPVAFAPYALEGFDHARLIPIRAADLAPEDSLLLIGSAAAEIDIWVVPIPFPVALPALRLASANSVGDLQDHLAVADLDGDDRDELALTWPGDDTVLLLETAPGGPTVVERARVALPAASSGRGCFADVDGDGALDLLVQLADGAVALSRGDGDGSLGGFAIDDRFSVLPEGALLLAAGRIDADARADFVTSDGVYLQRDAELVRSTSTPTAPAYSAAVILDHNGDGRADVGAATAAPDAVHLLIGAGDGELTTASVATAGAPFGLRVADLDGDGLDDLAFAVRDAAPSRDDAMIWFGRASGGPDTPVRIARLPTIERVEVAHLRDTLGVLDSARDLVIAMTPQRPTVRPLALLAGSPWRQLVSPLVLRLPASAAAEPPGTPHALATGRFIDRDQPPGWIALVAHGDDSRLWIVPGAADARFSSEQAYWSSPTAAGDLPPDPPDLWLAGDVDGDGLDELLWLAGSGDRLAAAIAEVDATGVLSASAIELEGLGRPLRGHLVDVDRDGAIDLLLTFDGGAALYTGGPQQWATTYLVLDAEDAAVVDLDGDAARELALLRDGRVELVDLQGTPPSAVRARALAFEAPDALTVVSGDIDGDGVDDLVTADGGHVRVHRVRRHTEAAP